MKKLIRVLILAATVLGASVSVPAASGGYVPSTIKVYFLENGKWVNSDTRKKTYSNDGRLKKETTTSKSSLGDDTYTWKNNVLTVMSEWSYGKGNVYTYTYDKKNRCTKFVNDSAAGVSTYSYKWNKKSAKIKQTDGPKTAGKAWTQKVNSKNQIISNTVTYDVDATTKTTYKYYADGKLKQISVKRKGPGFSTTEIRKYNEDGYPVSETGNDYKITWTYKLDKKRNCPKQVIVNASVSGTKTKIKYVVTKFKKVSKIRNCDLFGKEVPLIPTYMMLF